jgi:hypothetical protein
MNKSVPHRLLGQKGPTDSLPDPESLILDSGPAGPRSSVCETKLLTRRPRETIMNVRTVEQKFNLRLT